MSTKLLFQSILKTKWIPKRTPQLTNPNAYKLYQNRPITNLFYHREIPNQIKCNNQTWSVQQRYYTSKPDEKDDKRWSEDFPLLMQHPVVIWPSLLMTIKNWIFAKLIIQPYFDQDFTTKSFTDGSKKAVEIVSKHLAEGEFDKLTGLVEREALDVLKQSISKLSVAQRHALEIREEDIFFSFPYQIGVFFDESNKDIQRRFVEITMVYFALKGFAQMMKERENMPMNIHEIPEFRDKYFILNYRFIREYTKGVEDQWTVNVFNHFKFPE